VTDLTGRCFVSYRRSRSEETRHLVLALHDLGLPTWQDITNLDAEPTAEELRAVLRDPTTASALVRITPDVEGSDIIRKAELPEIVGRKRANDGSSSSLSPPAVSTTPKRERSPAATSASRTWPAGTSPRSMEIQSTVVKRHVSRSSYCDSG
jgi:hypothetical protein